MRSPAPDFLLHLQAAMDARSGQRQMEALQACVESLLADANSNRWESTRAALYEALLSSRGNIRRLRTLEFCASVVFDKPALPVVDGEFPEFLWMFAVPFTVTFGKAALSQPTPLASQVVDAEAIVGELEASNYFNPMGVLRSSSRLFKREDLQVLGPVRLAEIFLQAELSQEDFSEPLPLMLDPELDAYRSVTLFMLMASRLPAGSKSVFNRQAPWPGDALARVIHASLASQGIAVESVESHIAHSITEMHLRIHGPGAWELEANLANSKKAYGEVQVSVRFDIAGYSEIVGKLPDGSHAILIPAFSHLETEQELTRYVGDTCERLGLPFVGGFVNSQHTMSSTVH